MFGGAPLSINRHMIQFVNLLGLMLGVLGTLFLTYDLLGRRNGPLRWFLRVVVPSLVGLFVSGLLLLGVNMGLTAAGQALPVGRLVYWAITGVVIGAFNGFFVDSPEIPAQRRFAFSVKDAFVGALVTFTLYAIASAFDTMGNYITRVFPYGLYVALAGWLVAGFWRRLNRNRSDTGVRPSWFSWKGFLIGAFAGWVLLVLFLVPDLIIFALNPPPGVLPDSTPARIALFVVFGVFLVLIALILGGPAGAVVGGFSRYMFWWANSLPERGMQIIGVTLILVAFVAQTVEPVTGLLDIPLG